MLSPGGLKHLSQTFYQYFNFEFSPSINFTINISINKKNNKKNKHLHNETI